MLLSIQKKRDCCPVRLQVVTANLVPASHSMLRRNTTGAIIIPFTASIMSNLLVQRRAENRGQLSHELKAHRSVP